jgi:hypothetical protein
VKRFPSQRVGCVENRLLIKVFSARLRPCPSCRDACPFSFSAVTPEPAVVQNALYQGALNPSPAYVLRMPLDAASPDPLNQLAAPSGRLEGIREILCLVHDFTVAQLHYAHRV